LEIWHLHYKLKQKHYNKENLSRLRHTTCREIHIKEKTHQYLKKKKRKKKGETNYMESEINKS
jgi:hypothetical protein